MSSTGIFTRKPKPAAGGTTQPAPAGGPRIPTQPRERRPGLAALAVVIVLGSALGTAVLVRQAGERVAAVEVTQQIAPGQKISAGALTQVQVAKDSGVKFVPWEQRDLLISKYTAAVEIPPGTLLTGRMLTDAAGLAADQAVVGLSLKAGQFPPGLKAGDRVRVMWVGRDAAAKGTSPAGTATGAPNAQGNNGAVELAPSAIVREVFKPGNGDASSALSLSVVVPATASGGVTQAASSGDVALVLLPGTAQ
ncbi:hypothetical protein ACFWXO_13635 [Kitasatospora sp. NPDC059088]|uniref:hypothetical protein n=1 Tax=Kitasatospora sp. NPDC059088 TaxID=3346722 RepID=UPI0036A32FF8